MLTFSPPAARASFGWVAACLMLLVSHLPSIAQTPAAGGEAGAPPAAAAAAGDAVLAAKLADVSKGKPLSGGVAVASAPFLSKLYATLGTQPAWSNPANVEALKQAVARSWEDGLTTADFHAEALANPGTRSMQEQDILMSDALVRLLYQLYFGKVYPNALDPNWNFARPMLSGDPADLISKALAQGSIADLINSARIDHPLYSALKATLQAYTQYDANGGWSKIAEGPALKPGADDVRINAVRARLAVTGEYAGPAEGTLYDAALVGAVKKFQDRVGLDADGVLGQSTIAAMNVTAAERIDQIRINLERARWILRTIGPEMVAVNIAGHYLHLVLGGKRVWTTRVIVGKAYNKTPIFTETMKLVVLNPDWTVPSSIVRNEIFPKAAANPSYLDANNYYLTSGSGTVSSSSVDWSAYTGATFPYRVVQRPGPKNALGQVKFLFPNKYSVYLHDTPSRQLFAKSERTLSHGCIRVENPLKLAELILGDRLGYDRAKIDSLLATGTTQTINIKKPLPVLLLYWTVDPTFDGGARFHRDVYGRDVKLLAALNAPFKPGPVPEQQTSATDAR